MGGGEGRRSLQGDITAGLDTVCSWLGLLAALLELELELELVELLTAELFCLLKLWLGSSLPVLAPFTL